jgi:cell division protein FtsA
MKLDDTVACLDIGSSKICCAILERHDLTYNIAGFSSNSCFGVKEGTVSNVDVLSKAIVNEIFKLEEQTKLEVNNIFVNISGSYIKSLNANAVLNIEGHSKKIKQYHIEKVTKKLQDTIEVEDNEEILQVIINDFSVDDQEGVVNPIDMLGDKLEIKAHVILSKINQTHNLINCINKAGFGINEIYINSCLAGESVLAEQEKELGVLLIDIGLGVTDIILYKNNKIEFSHILPGGGEIIVKEIASKLRVSMETAEELMKKYGYVGAESGNEEEEITMPDIYGQEVLDIQVKDISDIINNGVEKLLEQIRIILYDKGYLKYIAGGIVFTGGFVLLKGLVKKTVIYLECPVRVGNVSITVDKTEEVIKGAEYSVICGLISVVKKQEFDKLNYIPEINFFRSLKEKVKTFFLDIF